MAGAIYIIILLLTPGDAIIAIVMRMLVMILILISPTFDLTVKP